MTTKKFYAASHYYGIQFANDYATLYRFPSRTARDEFVDEQQHRAIEAGCDMKVEALTRDESRRHFPDAFRMVGNFHDHTDERDWISHDNDTWAYWCDTNLYYAN